MSEAEQPIPLSSNDGIVYAYACSRCHHVPSGTEAMCTLDPNSDEFREMVEFRKSDADSCCRCRRCKAPFVKRLFKSFCETCEPIEQAEMVARAMATNAEVFTSQIHAKDHSGWVLWEDHGKRDGFFRSIAELEEYCADHELPLPQTVIACAPKTLSMDARDIIQQALEEHHEDACEAISTTEREELQAFLDGWCERTGVVSYEPTTTEVMLWEMRDGEMMVLT